jgi:putative transport protein
MYVGKYVFRFDDAIVLGCCCGARTTTSSLGMVNDRARSKIPALGYAVPYAVSTTSLAIGGMALVMLLT